MTTRKTVRINKKNSVSVIAAGPMVKLDSELYAINWFDLKHPWLYDFYNQLAFPHVNEIGGRVHFKGTVAEKIKGPEENDRQMLLIVKYPGADQFLKMVSNKLFLLKSLLRIRSVDYFTFGFTRRMDQGPPPIEYPEPYEGNLIYFSHHFQTKSSPSKYLFELQEILSSFSIETHFMGYKAALIGRSSQESKLRTQTFLMDGLAVLAVREPKVIDEFINYKPLQVLNSSNLTNSYYRLDRVL